MARCEQKTELQFLGFAVFFAFEPLKKEKNKTNKEDGDGSGFLLRVGLSVAVGFRVTGRVILIQVSLRLRVWLVSTVSC